MSPSRIRQPRLVARVALVAVAILVVGAGTAAAHVSADPALIPADRPVIVAFTVKHGCDGSPTVRLRFAVPDGLIGVGGAPKAGWKVENTAKTVTFSGGELAATAVDHFDLAFTATGAARTVYFPLVQTCSTGELAWIALPEPGTAEPAYPAPAVVISGSDPPITVAVPGGTKPPSTEPPLPVVTNWAGSTTVTTTGAPNGSTGPTSTSAPAVPSTTQRTDAAPDDGGSSAPSAVLAVAALVALGVALAAVLLRRRRPPTSPPTA